MAALQLIVGLALLGGGGELLTRGALRLARGLGVSPLLVGATVVAFGTSAPELAVSVDAAARGHPALALGNVVGSNIANVLLVLGLAGLVAPLSWSPRALRRDAFTLVLASAAFASVSLTSRRIGAGEGIALLSLLFATTALGYWRERRRSPVRAPERDPQAAAERTSLVGATFVCAAGLVGVVAGAELVVEGASALARAAGVSEAAIGLSLVAVGTSLPELATSVVATARGQVDVAIGNVVGSNVMNQLAIAGAAAIAAPLAVPAEMLRDLWGMLGLMVALSLGLTTASRLGRIPSALLVTAYAVWIAMML